MPTPSRQTGLPPLPTPGASTAGPGSAAPQVLLLAVPGMDWSLLQVLVTAGRLPHLARLLRNGQSGRLQPLPPADASATWASIATGVLADRHGLYHGDTVLADGLSLAPAGAEQLLVPPLWHRVAHAGLVPRVAGWPAAWPQAAGDNVHAMSTRNATAMPWPPLPAAGRIVLAGAETALCGPASGWPLAPGTVRPAALRHAVRQACVHPDVLPAHTVRPLLLPGTSVDKALDDHPLLPASRRLLARWTGLQALATGWAGEPGWALLALRLDGLAGWAAQQRSLAPGTPLPQALAPWYGWLDDLLGRLLRAAGPACHVLLVSETNGESPDDDTAAASRWSAGAPGLLLLAGPGVPPGTLPRQASALDLAPTVLGLLGLPLPTGDQALDGSSLLLQTAPGTPTTPIAPAPPAAPTLQAKTPARTPPIQTPAPPPRRRLVAPLHPPVPDALLPAAPPPDSQTMAWLARNGVPAADTTAWQAGAAAARSAACLSWAQAYRTRPSGIAPCPAIGLLQRLLAEVVVPPRVRAMLAEWLLTDGRPAEAAALLSSPGPNSRQSPWRDAFGGLRAHALGDWPLAEAHLLRLAGQGGAPINAPTWLGWGRLQRQDWASAALWFEAALSRQGGQLHTWEGYGVACLHLGRSARAEQAFRRALAWRPWSAPLHLHHAQALAATGASQAAQDSARRALALDPSLHDATLLLVWLSSRSAAA